MKKHLKSVVMSAILGVSIGFSAQAQSWPTKPLRIVVPYAPGGNTDTMGRILAEGLSKELGQPVVVENRPGATALIGTNFVADSATDGYTYLLNTISLVISPHIFNSIQGDLHSKFEPVSQIASISKVLVVNPSSPVNSVSELIEHGKKAEHPLSYGTTGVGSANHLMAELFSMTTGVELMHVPYGSSSPAMTDLIGNEIDLIFEDLPPVAPFVTSGRLKALMVASKERSEVLKDIPSASEQGFDDLIVEPWNGVLAPKGTSPEIVAAMDEAIKKVVDTEEYQTRLKGAGAQPLYRNSKDYASFIQDEYVRWGEVVQKAGIPKQ